MVPRDPESARHRRLVWAIFALGAILRVALTWRNPPFNAWDDHFEPIRLLLTDGSIPPKFACFQCYHPPVFYVVSGAIAWGVSILGLAGAAGLKLLQYLNTAFGIATLLFTLAIVERLPVSRSARLAASVIVAVLPRHVYVSAAHGNDGLAVLLVTIVIWMLMGLGDGRASWKRYAALGAAASLAIFTKYNALVVLPAIGAALATTPSFRDRTWRRPAALRAALALGLPMLLLGTAMVSNHGVYGTAFPGNDEYARRNPGIPDFVAAQPRDRPDVDFLRFAPWRYVAHPLLRPGQLNEFWTLMHASLWFDNDAKFVQLLASEAWTDAYYGWLSGDAPYPGDPPDEPAAVALGLGSMMGLLGTMVLVLGALGACTLVLGAFRTRPPPTVGLPTASALIAVVVCNVLGTAFWAARVPVYSAMKAMYLLPSLGAIAVALALGFAQMERSRATRRLTFLVCVAVVVTMTAHVGQIVLAPG